MTRMKKYTVRIKCLASYTVDVEVPEKDNLEDWLRDMLPELDIGSLEFYDDLDQDFIIDVRECE